MTGGARFQKAVADATANPDAIEPVVEMMSIACESATPAARRWASTWLLANKGVKIVHPEDESSDDAAPTEATHIR